MTSKKNVRKDDIMHISNYPLTILLYKYGHPYLTYLPQKFLSKLLFWKKYGSEIPYLHKFWTSNSKKPETLSFILSFFLSVIPLKFSSACRNASSTKSSLMILLEKVRYWWILLDIAQQDIVIHFLILIIVMHCPLMSDIFKCCLLIVFRM